METPKFFAPNSDDAEECYTKLASRCGVHPEPPNRRIYSISYTSDRQSWIATVGQRLKGVETKVKGRRTQQRETTIRLSDSATVLAIFAGIPYIIVTDAQPIADVRSAWANPFMVGKPTSVTYFAE